MSFCSRWSSCLLYPYHWGLWELYLFKWMFLRVMSAVVYKRNVYLSIYLSISVCITRKISVFSLNSFTTSTLKNPKPRKRLRLEQVEDATEITLFELLSCVMRDTEPLIEQFRVNLVYISLFHNKTTFPGLALFFPHEKRWAKKSFSYISLSMTWHPIPT